MRIQPETNREYTKVISDFCDIKAVIPEKTPFHPNVLSPVNISYDGNCSYLHYSVTGDGMTLREFIYFIHNPRKKMRATIFDTIHRIHPIDIMLQLIDAYEFMLKNNLMMGQSNVNPDCIWIERSSSGTIHPYVMDTLETVIDNRYRTIDDNRRYWSSEYISEYNHLMCYSDGSRKPNLTRRDTKPTPISIVYSLGLVLYFIVEHHDPYHEIRIHADERPNFKVNCNERYRRLIYSATEPDIKKRPTLKEWKEMLQTPEKRCVIS